MLRMARVLIAGCGYVGTAVAERLVAGGHEVWGLRRNPGKLPSGIHPVAADLTDPETLRSLPEGLDCVCYTAAADGFTDEAYRAAYVDGLRILLDALQSRRRQPRRIVFTSSTVVYAQSAGEWVDETSPTAPVHFAGTRMLEAEGLVRHAPFAATVVRLGGVYGPGRGGLIDRVRRGEAVCTDGPPRYSNRIHRDDCTGALEHVLTAPRPDELYLGVDHEPAEECAVLRWVAAQLGVPPPRVASAPGGGPRGRRGNKRCRNAKLVASGYTFRYPTFREGYAALLAEQEP